ncbi:MAG: Ig-like domain-containing protein [Vallitalea sp.]|nr:Ig-like domain-containing protein [Vallitalea sp.]
MKNFKKVCALVLSLAMVFSTFAMPTFAAEEAAEISAEVTDAKICEGLNLIQGSGNGVTEEYLATESPRWKIAIMSLRLRGKYEEALAYEGTETFADAEDMTWTAGRAALAYLKANPELGWQGNDNKFNPNGMMTVKAYYKVMLETLGYKQDTDFTWGEVMEFAASKGLKVAADAEKLTMNDVAAVTVETLKAENSEGTVLLNALVEAGAIEEEKAVELLDYTVPVTAKMVSAKAIDATTVVVNFDEAVEVTADDFAVVAGDDEFAVSAVTSADAGKVAVLTVAEMKVGSKYSVTYGEVSKTVVPTIKDDKTKPAIEKAEAITGAVVNVVFNTRNLNKNTLISDNFSLNNDATVLSAEINTEAMKEEEFVGKTVVTLGVTGLKSGKGYTIKSTNVESYEGLVADESKDTFAGKDADKKGPELFGAESEAGYLVKVYFAEDVKLDEATATDIANYSISPELEIKAAKLDKNVIGKKKGYNVVILTTSYQKSGTAYTLTVNNVSDGTNVMKEAAKAVFAGKDKADNQKAKKAESLDATKVKVEFEYECNETALDIANYEINNDIEVTAAEFEEDVTQVDKLNQKAVILTTSEMKSGKAYTVTVKTGVQDILGQGLKESAKLIFAGKDKDVAFTSSISVKAKDPKTVVVTFGERLDRASVLELSNYAISDLGYPSEATLNAAGDVVTLKVAEQKSGESYTITFNNIKDKAGNVIKADTKKTFTGVGEISTKLKVTEVKALSKDKVKVTFNEEIERNSTNTFAEADDVEIKNTSKSGETISFDLGFGSSDSDIYVGTNYVILTVDSDTKLNGNYIYRVTWKDDDKTIQGKRTKHDMDHDHDSLTFVGKDNEKAEFDATIEYLNKTYVKVIFTEPLTTPANASDFAADFVKLYKNADLTGDVIKSVKDTTNNTLSDNKKELTLRLDSELSNDTVYYVRIDMTYDGSNELKSGPAFLKTETEKDYRKLMATTSTLKSYDEVQLAVAQADMKDVNTIEVKFNAAVKGSLTPAKVKVASVKTGLNNSNSLAVSSFEKVDEKTYRLFFNDTNSVLDESNGINYVVFTSGHGLSTKIGDQGFATDKHVGSFAINKIKNEAPSIVVTQPITNSKIKVVTSERIYSDNSQTRIGTSDTGLFVIYNKDTGREITDFTLEVVSGAGKDKEFYIELAGGVFVKNANYQIGLKPTVFGVDGIVPAKEYKPSLDKTANSKNFGGNADALSKVTGNGANTLAPSAKNLKSTDGHIAKLNEDSAIFVPGIALLNNQKLVVKFTDKNDKTIGIIAEATADVTPVLGEDDGSNVTHTTLTGHQHSASEAEAYIANPNGAVKVSELAEGDIKVTYSVIDAAGNETPVSDEVVVKYDATVPTLTSVGSAIYDKSDNQIVITVEGAGAIGDLVDVTKITLKGSNIESTNSTYVLTDSTGTITSDTEITITVSDADNAAINWDVSSITFDVDAGLLTDEAGNATTTTATGKTLAKQE